MGTSDTLRAVIDAGRGSKRLDELSTARVVGKIAELVHAAQQKAGAGKAIGPITPASISITDMGEVKLGLTEPNAVAYSAPEQLSGGATDRRTDVFSLGAVMWEALTHQRLFDALNDAAVKVAVQEREIRPPGELNANIPAELSAICMKALARNPSERYQSAKVMAVEVEEVLSQAGYADSNEQIAAYIAEMAPKAKLPLPKVAPAITKAEPTPPKGAPTIAKPEPTPAVEAPAPAAAAATPPPHPLSQTLLGTPVGVSPPPPTPPVPSAGVTLISTPPGATVPAAQPSAPISTFGRSIAPGAATVAAGETRRADPTPPRVPAPPILPASARANGSEPPPAAAVAAAPAEALATEGSGPNPAAIVALPSPAESRESQRLLQNWAWQTDSVGAIDDDDDYAPPSNKKWLIYVLGGGLGVAGLVTVIMLGFGGNKPSDKPAPSAAAREGSDPAIATAEPPSSATGSSGSAEPAVAGSDVGSAGSAIAETGSGSGSGPAPIDPYADKPQPAVAGSATPTAEPTPPTPAPPPPPVEPPKPAKPDKVAKPEPPKPAKIDHPKPPTHVARAEPPRPPKPAPAKPDTSKADVENSYRIGLQQFARGDTSGALASLRTSLAGNPNFPPTWRGLGLVFEKLGEKDQARAAYKRYLQLAPNAGDADQIRGRLERL